MDADTIEKYRKVKALALHGATEGERKAAASVLTAMDRKYPGIGVAAVAPPPPTPDGAFGFPPSGAAGTAHKGGFRASGRAAPPKPPGAAAEPHKEGFVGTVFDWLRNAAEGLREGMTLRERVLDMTDVASTVNTRSIRITVSIPLSALDEVLDEFGDDKDTEIATILSMIVRDEFMGTLSSMGVEDYDE